MTRSARHRRLHSILRTGLLLCLLPCLLLQTALAAMGEIHARIGHDAHHGAAHAPDEPAGDRDGSPLHALIHHAHCCSQAPGLASEDFGCTIPPAQAEVSAGSDDTMIAASPPGPPFRPPIQA